MVTYDIVTGMPIPSDEAPIGAREAGSGGGSGAGKKGKGKGKGGKMGKKGKGRK